MRRLWWRQARGPRGILASLALIAALCLLALLRRWHEARAADLSARKLLGNLTLLVALLIVACDALARQLD